MEAPQIILGDKGGSAHETDGNPYRGHGDRDRIRFRDPDLETPLAPTRPATKHRGRTLLTRQRGETGRRTGMSIRPLTGTAGSNPAAGNPTKPFTYGS